MGRIGNIRHEKVLQETIKELENKGYRLIDLKGRSPDAIAVKQNNGKLEINAVEVLGMTYRKNKGWHKQWTITKKEDGYSMFDNVIIRTFQ